MLHIGRRTLSDGKHNVLITKQYTRPLSHLMMTSTSSVFCFRWTAQAKSRYSNGVHFSRLSFTYRRHMYQVNMSEPSGEGGYREGGGEAETGGTRSSGIGGPEGREARQRMEGEGPHRTTVDLGLQTVRLRREDPPCLLYTSDAADE